MRVDLEKAQEKLKHRVKVGLYVTEVGIDAAL
jgi:hypothetical protein